MVLPSINQLQGITATRGRGRPWRARFILDLIDNEFLSCLGSGPQQRERFAVVVQPAFKSVENQPRATIKLGELAAISGQHQVRTRRERSAAWESVAQAIDAPVGKIEGETRVRIEELQE